MKRSKFNNLTALGCTLYGNWGAKGTGKEGPQDVVTMRCTTNQWNIVCQSDYALKAINGAGNDLLRLENKRKPGNPDLTSLEKSDSSRDFFSCLDFDSDRGDFLEFFGLSGGRTSHLGLKWTENRLGAFLEPVGTSNSVVSHVLWQKAV